MQCGADHRNMISDSPQCWDWTLNYNSFISQNHLKFKLCKHQVSIFLFQECFWGCCNATWHKEKHPKGTHIFNIAHVRRKILQKEAQRTKKLVQVQVYLWQSHCVYFSINIQHCSAVQDQKWLILWFLNTRKERS